LFIEVNINLLDFRIVLKVIIIFRILIDSFDSCFIQKHCIGNQR
jgi:hypothetical protein